MESKGTIEIWTLQMSRHRLAVAAGIKPLNITVKSGIQAFAPSWKALMAYKNKELTPDEYTVIYTEKMRQSKIDNPRYWYHLNHYPKVALMCYCADGDYCHRHLFAEEMKENLETRGYTVILHGELRPA